MTVVEYDSQNRVQRDVDVVLLAASGQAPSVEAARVSLLSESLAKVLIFTWRTDLNVVAALIKRGAAGVVSKTATPEEVVDVLRCVHRGGQVLPKADPTEREGFGRWTGDRTGVTSRKSEVLALGRRNRTLRKKQILSSKRAKWRRLGCTTSVGAMKRAMCTSA